MMTSMASRQVEYPFDPFGAGFSTMTYPLITLLQDQLLFDTSYTYNHLLLMQVYARSMICRRARPTCAPGMAHGCSCLI